MEQARERIAREIDELEKLDKARGSSDYQQLLVDSYKSMQLIERAAMMLDPTKPNFAISFANLQGRFRERLALTEELANGKKTMRQRKNLLAQISDKLKNLQARLKFAQPMQGSK